VSATLVARLDSVGDVLLGGPAVAVAAAYGPVDVLCSSVGRPAAELLPGVRRTIVFDAPWIRTPAPPVDAATVDRLVASIGAGGYGRAAILTSSHQSALPTAMLLRLAGVERLAAVSNDYPGSLLDHRITGDPEMHEVERALAVVAELGFGIGEPSTHRLRVDVEAAEPVPGRVVLHPGASAPARTLPGGVWCQVAAELARRGYEVVVTGTNGEGALCRSVAAAAGQAPAVLPAGALGELATLLSTAATVVSGNTGPMHLAAAVGRPVVAVFAPTVPPARWRPWGVPHVLLGELDIVCAGCRARVCPFPEQHCLSGIGPSAVAGAIDALATQIPPRHRKELVR
jgi:ADP-heptose:LPS heptosyltransferase